MLQFSERLKKSRNDKKKENSKWTQEFVADKIGVARSTYTAYERGTKQPSLETINKIADLLNVTTDYLFNRTDRSNLFNYTASDEVFRVSDNFSPYGPLKDFKQFIIENDMQDIANDFYDIEKWRKLSKEDIEEVKRHFEWVVARAEQIEEEKRKKK